MFSISLVERTRFRAELAKVKAEIAQEVEDIFRGFVTVAYISVVENTPQWTGHATAQWNIGRNYMDVSGSTRYAEENLAVSERIRSNEGLDAGGALHAAAKQMGDPEAVAEAKQRQEDVVMQIKLADLIYISNNVESLLNESYASKLEENPNNYLRQENDGGHMIVKTMGWFNSRLAAIDPVARLQLRTVRLSASGIMETF